MILGGNLFWGKCNSVLGMQFRTCKNFQASTDSSLVESPKIFTNTKATPQFLEFASEAKQPSLPLRFCESQNLGGNSKKIAESSLDSAESQNLVKNNLCEAPENSPASWCKKSGEASSSASTDFLLEAEKRGSPPKSEKAAAFWRVGGAGRGVQPFLREKTRELNKQKSDDFAESTLDSAESQNLKSGLQETSHSLVLPRRFCESARNDGNNRIA